MRRKIAVLIIICMNFVYGCGPDTIWVRPSLDTPSQHVANGHQLLEIGKFTDACREFRRARDLDPNYLPAYIGLSLALGRLGDFENGLKQITMAESLAKSDEEKAEVEQGYERLKKLMETEQSTGSINQ